MFGWIVWGRAYRSSGPFLISTEYAIFRSAKTKKYMSASSQTIQQLVAQLVQKAQVLDDKTKRAYRIKYVAGTAEKVAAKTVATPDTEYISLLQNVVNSYPATKEETKVYAGHINRYDAYVRKKYFLVPAGYYRAVWLSLGIAIGLPLGLSFKNIAAGIPIGLGIGLAVGTGLESKARKEGRLVDL